MNSEDFNAFLAAAIAEGDLPISAGGPPFRALVPPINSSEFIAAAVAEGTLPISAGNGAGVEGQQQAEPEAVAPTSDTLPKPGLAFGGA